MQRPYHSQDTYSPSELDKQIVQLFGGSTVHVLAEHNDAEDLQRRQPIVVLFEFVLLEPSALLPSSPSEREFSGVPSSK